MGYDISFLLFTNKAFVNVATVDDYNLTIKSSEFLRTGASRRLHADDYYDSAEQLIEEHPYLFDSLSRPHREQFKELSVSELLDYVFREGFTKPLSEYNAINVRNLTQLISDFITDRIPVRNTEYFEVARTNLFKGDTTVNYLENAPLQTVIIPAILGVENITDVGGYLRITLRNTIISVTTHEDPDYYYIISHFENDISKFRYIFKYGKR